MRNFASLGEAWLYCLHQISRYGEVVFDENVRVRDISLSSSSSKLKNYPTNNAGNLALKLKELRGLNITIYNVDLEDSIIKKYADKERVLYTLKRYGANCGKARNHYLP